MRVWTAGSSREQLQGPWGPPVRLIQVTMTGFAPRAITTEETEVPITRRLMLLGCPTALAMCAASLHSTAAEYPDRPIRYVLPSAPGGGPDVAARIVMGELGRQLGK